MGAVFPICVLMAIYFLIGVNFGVLNAGQVVSVFNTDWLEAKEFLSNIPVWQFLVPVAVIGMLMVSWWKVAGVQSKYKNYVLVIGESNRWDYMHAYGYPLENTPFMESRGLLLEGMMSVADYTIPSLQKALTKTSKDASVNYAMTVVDLANCAGFKTYLFSNQGYIDKKKYADYGIGRSCLGEKLDKTRRTI